METYKLYVSSIEELYSYTRTRFAPAVFLPLALFMFAAAAAGADQLRWTELLPGAALACTLLFQFRLWDDLADREYDAASHPDRVLVASGSIAKYRFLAALAFVVNAAVIAIETGSVRFGAFLALNLAMLAWYGYLRSLTQSRLVRSHILLLKYPFLVFILNGLFPASAPLATGYSMLLVYLSFCIHEWLHDPLYAGDKSAFRSLTLEAAVLVTAPLWVLPLLPQFARGLVLLSVAAALVAAVAASHAVGRYRAGRNAGLWTYTPFPIALVHILLINAWSTS